MDSHEIRGLCFLYPSHCLHQAFALDNILALQCHVEMTVPMVREWAGLYRDELDDDAPGVQTATEITADLDARIHAAQRVADRLYLRWLRPLLANDTRMA